MLRRLVGLLIVVASVACGATPRPDDAQIFGAVVSYQGFAGELGDGTLLVLAELAPPAAVMRGHMPESVVRGDLDGLLRLGVSPSLVEGLRETALRPGVVPRSLVHEVPVALISESEWGAPPGGPLPLDSAFAQRHQGKPGFIRFSQIGFNASRSEAVVVAAIECGPLCSHSDAFVLQRHSDTWAVAERKVIWIS